MFISNYHEKTHPSYFFLASFAKPKPAVGKGLETVFAEGISGSEPRWQQLPCSRL